MEPKPTALGERRPRDEKLKKQLLTKPNASLFGEYAVKSQFTNQYGETEKIDLPRDDCVAFQDLNLHPWIMENISEFGYRKPTPVQYHAIPILLKKQDLLGIAPTGFGKTAAFLLPMIHNILERYSTDVDTWISVDVQHQKAIKLSPLVVVNDIDRGKSWKITARTSRRHQKSVMVQLKTHNACSCLISCRYCGVCPKMYTCQCEEFLNENEICQHIHLVQMHCNNYHYCAPRGLVLAETRELVKQIHKEALKFTYRIPLECGIAYGGNRTQSQRQTALLVKDGCDILIATPGRLIRLLDEGVVWLHQCRFLVLDDCDRTLDRHGKRPSSTYFGNDEILNNLFTNVCISDMGFEEQVDIIVRMFDMPQPGVRQTALLTATLPMYLSDKHKNTLKHQKNLVLLKFNDESPLFNDWIKYVASPYLSDDYVYLGITSSMQAIVQEVVWKTEEEKTLFTAHLLISNPGMWQFNPSIPYFF